MGHRISAAIVRGPLDQAVARELDMCTIELSHGVVLIALDACYCDHWSAALGVEDRVASPVLLLNCSVVHQMIGRVAGTDALFALIETDYFGGTGEQAAAVYRGAEPVMAPRRANGGVINEALRHLGIQRRGLDEFDTLGLGRFRDFDERFEKYRK